MWQAALSRDGYGLISIDSRLYYAHVVGWSWHHRCHVPLGRVLDHLCRTRRCIRPTHTEPKTNKENVLIGTGLTAENARKTHCPRNHPYDETNTIITQDGRRRCRICESARTRKRRHHPPPVIP